MVGRPQLGRPQLTLQATVDGAGDGWVDITMQNSAVRIVGFNFHLVACPANATTCKAVPVFGGRDGTAEEAGLFVAAGHVFTHRIFAFCVAESCEGVPATAGAAANTWCSGPTRPTRGPAL